MSIGEGHTLPFFVPFCIIIPLAQMNGGWMGESKWI
jgi:hypothetical protein